MDSLLILIQIQLEAKLRRVQGRFDGQHLQDIGRLASELYGCALEVAGSTTLNQLTTNVDKATCSEPWDDTRGGPTS